MDISKNASQTFDQYRILLFSIAYRMLGSAVDAEDIVQEAFLRWLEVNKEGVQSPKAYLSAIVTRLCIDQLRSARMQREVYVGPWLPEPITTNGYQELVETPILAESLSFAFLVMLESLGPLERAVFLLREVFAYDYPEIATIVEKSAANCRQALHRAHQHLHHRRPRFDVSSEQQERITNQFLQASSSGDMQGLLNLLTDDIVLTSDGGGKVRAALKPIYGPDKVARGMLGILSKVPANLHIRIGKLNNYSAFIAYLDDHINSVLLLDIANERIQHIYLIVNPDKLQWLDKMLPS